MIINKPINFCSWYLKRFYSKKFWVYHREDLNQIAWLAILSCEPQPESKILLRTLRREIYHFYKSRKPYTSGGPVFGEKRWNDKKMYDKGYENSLIDYIDINLPVRPVPRRTAFSLVERQAEMKIRYGKKKRVHLTINS